MKLNSFLKFRRKNLKTASEEKTKPADDLSSVSPLSDESHEGESGEYAAEASRPDESAEPATPVHIGPSDKALEEWVEHYTDQFWTGASRTNTILVTWGASLALIFVALIPLSGRAARYEETYGRYEDSRVQLARDKKRSFSRLDAEKQYLEEQIENAQAGRKKRETEMVSRINALRERIQAINEKSKEEKERFKEREVDLDTRFRDIKTLKSDLFPFNVPMGKLDIPVSYTPLVWVFLFTGFLFYFFYKRLVLIGAIAQVLHIQVDLRGKKIGDLRGLGSGAPFWIAPLPPTFSGSCVSREEVRQFLGWEPRALRRSTLTYAFLAAATLLYVWVTILAIKVVRIYDNPQLELGLMIAIIGTFALLAVLCWAWLLPRIQLESYPETLIASSTRRRVLLGVFSSVAVVGYVYISTPRRFLSHRLLTDSKRSKRLALARRARKALATSETQWRGTFQLNQRTQVIHYVSPDGRTKTLGSRRRTATNYTPYSKGDVIEILTTSDEKGATKTPFSQGEKTGGRSEVVRGRGPASGNTDTRAHLTEREDPLTDSRGRLSVAVNDRDSNTTGAPRDASVNSKRPRIASAQIGTTAERLAVEKLQAGDIALALKILWGAIKEGGRSEANYRLYDLFALIAVQHSRAEQLKELIEYLSNDTELKKRVDKWKEPSSKWAAKVKGGGKKWKMPANLM